MSSSSTDPSTPAPSPTAADAGAGACGNERCDPPPECDDDRPCTDADSLCIDGACVADPNAPGADFKGNFAHGKDFSYEAGFKHTNRAKIAAAAGTADPTARNFGPSRE